MKSAQKGKSSKKNNYYTQINKNDDDDNLNNNIYMQDIKFGNSNVSGIDGSSHSGSRRTPRKKDIIDSEDIKERNSGKKDNFFNNNLDDLDYSSKTNSVYDERKEDDSERKGSYKVKEKITGKK